MHQCANALNYTGDEDRPHKAPFVELWPGSGEVWCLQCYDEVHHEPATNCWKCASVHGIGVFVTEPPTNYAFGPYTVTPNAAL